jgi:hypothetical protein
LHRAEEQQPCLDPLPAAYEHREIVADPRKDTVDVIAVR